MTGIKTDQLKKPSVILIQKITMVFTQYLKKQQKYI